MAKTKKDNFLITSDLHFGHRGILRMERANRFSTLEEHDSWMEEFLEKGFRNLSNEATLGGPQENTLYFLGDWGIATPEIFQRLKSASDQSFCRKVAIRGNHDEELAMEQMEELGFEVSEVPIFLSKRVMLSHHPILFESDTYLNVSGHLHGAKLSKRNHMCASVAVANYNYVSKEWVNKKVSTLDTYDMRFLYEPFAQYYQFNNSPLRQDVIADKEGRIDLAATRTLDFLSRRQER